MTHLLAERAHTPLEQTLLDVHTTLADLLAAADDQHQAVACGNRERLESVTRRQERLAARLQRAERQRLSLLQGRPLNEAVSHLPAADAARVSRLVDSIGHSVRRLRERQASTASLLERSIDLAGQTIQFLQRLAGGQSQNQAYTTRGLVTARQSLLVDSRA
jgi:flagellar biosynthesis/type III secretory pathway chaperone